MQNKYFHKTIINPEYQESSDFLRSIPSIFATQGKEIYTGRNVIKTFTLDNGAIINVKRYGQPHLINKFIYSLGIRKPKGLRAYLYPFVLAQKQIATPKAIAYIEERNALGLLSYSYFIYEQCPYTHNLYDWAGKRDAEAHQKAIALAQFTAYMHNQEVLHKDFSPGNILWEKDEKGYHFSIIDINRMRFGKVSIHQGCANFARLWAITDVFRTLAHTYAQARGFDSNECEHLILHYRNRFWKQYAKHHDIHFNLD